MVQTYDEVVTNELQIRLWDKNNTTEMWFWRKRRLQNPALTPISRVFW